MTRVIPSCEVRVCFRAILLSLVQIGEGKDFFCVDLTWNDPRAFIFILQVSLIW